MKKGKHMSTQPILSGESKLNLQQNLNVTESTEPQSKRQKTELSTSTISSYISSLDTIKKEIIPLFDQLKDKFKEYSNTKLTLTDSSGSDNEKKVEQKHDRENFLSTEIEELENNILGQVNTKLELKNFIQTEWRLEKGSFKDDMKSEEQNKHTNFLSELFFNHVMNQSSFALSLKDFLHSNKKLIITKFKPNLISQDLDLVTVEITSTNGETHLRGRKPVIVSFKKENNLLLKVVVKPRSASIDKAVIDLFTKLNQLPSNERGEEDLPTYQIENMEGSDNFEWSVWEFVEGQECDIDAENTLLNRLKNNPQARRSLERLENICAYIGLSDLHRENVIQRGSFWYPIDLEVVDPGKKTGLYQHYPANLPKLSSKEIELMNEFIKFQQQVNVRYVPIPTVEFKEKLDAFNGHIDIASKIDQLFKKIHLKQYEVKLADLIFSDFSNGDIPIFMIKDKKIFYASYKQKLLLAEKKN